MNMVKLVTLMFFITIIISIHNITRNLQYYKPCHFSSLSY